MFDPYLELGKAALPVDSLNAAEGNSKKHACELLLLGPQCHATMQSIHTPCFAWSLARGSKGDGFRIKGAPDWTPYSRCSHSCCSGLLKTVSGDKGASSGCSLQCNAARKPRLRDHGQRSHHPLVSRGVIPLLCKNSLL